MTWQRYTSDVAKERMANDKCPECGRDKDEHGGWGLRWCSLTDTGVAGRIYQFRMDQIGVVPKDDIPTDVARMIQLLALMEEVMGREPTDQEVEDFILGSTEERQRILRG